MAKATTPISLGLAEFTAKLIEETYEAVASSQADQECRLGEMVAMAKMDMAAYAEAMVPSGAVALELAALFPTSAPNRAHAIYIDAPYLPARGDQVEAPAIYEALGLKLGRRDYTISRKRGVRLKRSAVDRVAKAVRLRLAASQQDALRQSLQQGMPRLMVDSGSVSAKLTFQLLRIEDADDPDIRKMLAVPIKPLSRGSGLQAPELNGIRLLARSADDRAPQANRLQADVYGEVRITFKAVS